MGLFPGRANNLIYKAIRRARVMNLHYLCSQAYLDSTPKIGAISLFLSFVLKMEQ